MPKKTKKARRSTPATQKRVAAPVTEETLSAAAQPKTEPPATTTRAAFATKASGAAKVDLAQEYHYVFTDLRRIAIIAVVMFALLFALAFVLR